MTREEQRHLLACAPAGELTPELAGLLLAECRRDPTLLRELSRLIITERLLAYAHAGCDEATFVREVRQRLRAANAEQVGIPGLSAWWLSVWRRVAAWPWVRALGFQCSAAPGVCWTIQA